MAVLFQMPSAGAHATCSNVTLHGSYVYSADGFIAPPPFTPIAEAGTYTFDGSGSFSTANTLSVGGTIVPRSATGTYTVNADCSGTADVTGGVSFNFAITRAAQSLRFVVSTAGVVASGTMEKQ
jgi:hypothetical protein